MDKDMGIALVVSFFLMVLLGPIGLLASVILIAIAGTSGFGGASPSSSSENEKNVVTIKSLNQQGGPMLPSEALRHAAYNKGLSLTSKRCPECGVEVFSLEGMPAIDVEVLNTQALPEHQGRIIEHDCNS